MAVKDGCAKLENIAAPGGTDKGAVVSDKTPTNSSTQSAPKPSFMTSIDSAINTFTGAVEEVASAIDVGTRKLNAVDCSDMLFDFIKENVPLTLWDPVACRMPGFRVRHQLQGLAQTHVHRVSEAIQPLYPLSSPSPATLNLS